MTNLQKQIEGLNNEMATQVPKEILGAFANSIKDLKDRDIESSSMKEGMIVPPFVMMNTIGKEVSLTSLLENNDRVILAFFRGVWCPYCNLELRALQQKLDEIKGKDAVLVAISPQNMDYNQSMIENNDLTFDMLTDKDNAYAKQLGISFTLQDFVLPYYEQMGINLKQYNDNEDNNLPMPAVFVIDKNRKVLYSFEDSDYTNRIDIDELLTHI